MRSDNIGPFLLHGTALHACQGADCLAWYREEGLSERGRGWGGKHKGWTRLREEMKQGVLKNIGLLLQLSARSRLEAKAKKSLFSIRLAATNFSNTYQASAASARSGRTALQFAAESPQYQHHQVASHFSELQRAVPNALSGSGEGAALAATAP